MKVEQFYNKNQFIIRDEENQKIYFQSYKSIIAIWDKTSQTLTLGHDWDYSQTTSKHLYLFINDFCHIESFDINSKTKKQDIQKLINSGIIKYNENLK